MIIDILNKIEDFYNIPVLQFINKSSLYFFPKKLTFECKKCNIKMFSCASSCVVGGCIYCSKKDQCQECGRVNFLEKTDACADGYGCCTKKICYNECIYTCGICHMIFHNSEDIYVIDTNNNEDDNKEECGNEKIKIEQTSKFICNACNDKQNNIYTSRPKIWYGMSVEEYIEKYG